MVGVKSSGLIEVVGVGAGAGAGVGVGVGTGATTEDSALEPRGVGLGTETEPPGIPVGCPSEPLGVSTPDVASAGCFGSGVGEGGSSEVTWAWGVMARESFGTDELVSALQASTKRIGSNTSMRFLSITISFLYQLLQWINGTISLRFYWGNTPFIILDKCFINTTLIYHTFLGIFGIVVTPSLIGIH